METPVPIYAEYEFDIPEETKIRINTFSNGTFEGCVYVNPKTTENSACITLIKVVPVPATTDKEDEAMNIRRFFYREIQQIEVVEPASPTTDPKYLFKQATVKIVKERDELEVVVCEINKLDSVGLRMFGAGVVKDAEIGWVCFFAKGVVMAIDALKLSKEMSDTVFWNSLKSVMENTRTKKVMYNHSAIVLYLLNNHKIVMKEYDSLVDLDAVVHSKNADISCPRALSTLLEGYLKDGVNSEEMELLRKFEDMKILDDNAYLVRPFPVDEFAKIIAISCKHLLELKKKMWDVKYKKFLQLQQDFYDLLLAEDAAEYLKLTEQPAKLSAKYVACLEKAFADD